MILHHSRTKRLIQSAQRGACVSTAQFAAFDAIHTRLVLSPYLIHRIAVEEIKGFLFNASVEKKNNKNIYYLLAKR